jgi:hypothetical protein
VPSHDTIGRVLALIKPAQFQQAFLDWIASFVSKPAKNGEPRFVPIDGKTLRGDWRYIASIPEAVNNRINGVASAKQTPEQTAAIFDGLAQQVEEAIERVNETLPSGHRE